MNVRAWYAYTVILCVVVVIVVSVLIGLGYRSTKNRPDIAPIYALDSCTVDTSHVGATGVCYPNAGDFPNFWQEATKNTQFTIDGKPVEITDVQISYKKGWYSHDSVNTLYGNITYYPQGIEYSKTYVAPTPIICPTPSSSCPSRSCYDIITAPPCYIAPTPTPTPCAWQSERTAYSFCGKVIVNSSAEFDLLLKDIEKHSYHIQMGWMHLDYEYAHKTYDNTLPAPVNICMGIIPGDDFPIGSEWEGRMTYVIDECAPLGSCDFDTLILIPTPTPTPILAFPYEFCANGCVICTDHLGNCTYIPGRPTPTSTP